MSISAWDVKGVSSERPGLRGRVAGKPFAVDVPFDLKQAADRPDLATRWAAARGRARWSAAAAHGKRILTAQKLDDG